MDRQSEILGILIKEYFRITQDIQKIFDRIWKGTGFLLAVLSLLFGIGIKERICEVFLMAPISLCILVYYVIMHFELMITIGAYGAVIEERINDSLDSHVLIWESKLTTQLHHFRHSITTLLILLFLLSLFIVVYSHIHSYIQYPKLTLVNAVISFLAITYSIILIIKLKSLHPKTRQLIQRKMD